MLDYLNGRFFIPAIYTTIFLIVSVTLSAQLADPISCDDSGVPAFNVRACSQGLFVGSNISTRDNNLNLLADVSLTDIGGASSVVVMDGTEYCDENGDTGFSSEGPDVFFNIPVEEGKRESCEAAVLTITLRGDFNNGCEVAYIVNECGIIIQQSEVTGLPENDKCDVIFPLEIRIPAADITEMAADGVISFSIRTNGGTNGLQGTEVDGTCGPGRGVDCDGDMIFDGNCFAVESLIWPIADNSFAGTLNSTESIICPGQSLNIDVLQNLTFSDPLGLGDGDNQTGTYHLDFYYGGGPNPANPYDTNFGGVAGDVVNAYDVLGLVSNPSVTITNSGGIGLQDHTNSNAPLSTGGNNLPSNTLIEVLGSVWVDGDLEPSAVGFCTGNIIGCGFTTDYISFVLLDPISAEASCECISGNNAVVTISGFEGGLPSAVAAGATPGGSGDYILQPTGGVLSSTTAGVGGSVTLTLDPGETNWSVTIVDGEGCEFQLSGTCGIEEEAEIFLPTLLCIADEDIEVAVSPLGGRLTGPGVSGSTFNPANAGVGTHTLTYTFVEDGCEITTELDVTVQSGAELDASFQKSSDEVCPDDIIEFRPSVQGGVFMGFGVTDNGDGTGGTFTVREPGIYAITYTLNTSGGCSSVSTCIIEVRGTVDAPTIDVGASPICYTDGSSRIQFFNADGSILNLTNSFIDGDFTDPEITIAKIASSLVDGNNHEAVDAVADFGLTGAATPFQFIASQDAIRVIPEHLIGDSFEYAGIYEICLFIPEEDNEGCEDITACSQITIYPSMDPCFSLPGQLCDNGANFTIDVAAENPTFDDLNPDLLGRSRQEMSVWTLITPDGTVIEENEVGLIGAADGDVTIQTSILGDNFGTGLYTLNHEMGIDNCATFCSRTFEIIADQSVSFINEAIDCVVNATGIIDLESLNDGSTDNSLGGTWSIVSGPASGNFSGSSFFYSEAGCYRIRYEAPDLEGDLANCGGDTEDVFVRVSEQPQPSFEIQDQICFSDGDTDSHIYDALINSPIYTDNVTRVFSVVSGPATILNTTTGRVQITGVGTVVVEMMETISYGACNNLPSGSCSERVGGV